MPPVIERLPPVCPALHNLVCPAKGAGATLHDLCRRAAAEGPDSEAFVELAQTRDDLATCAWRTYYSRKWSEERSKPPAAAEPVLSPTGKQLILLHEWE